MGEFRYSETEIPAEKTAGAVYFATDSDVDSLVQRMVRGDRDAVGAFLVRYGEFIKRRIRGKIRSARMRRLYDSQDILSTLGRRLDVIVMHKRVRARTDGEFWSLVWEMAQNSIVEKARIVEGLRVKEGEDSGLARMVLNRIHDVERVSGEEGAEVAFHEMIATLDDEHDREIAMLWALGLSHAQIGESMDLAENTVRQQWHRIRGSLRDLLEVPGR